MNAHQRRKARRSAVRASTSTDPDVWLKAVKVHNRRVMAEVAADAKRTARLHLLAAQKEEG